MEDMDLRVVDENDDGYVARDDKDFAVVVGNVVTKTVEMPPKADEVGMRPQRRKRNARKGTQEHG
jgi:hypothetical protein